MPAQVIVVYPRESGSTFDKDYYLKTHMPLVEKTWEKHGLKSWKVTELGDGPYSISCLLEFTDMQAVGAAQVDSDTKVVMDDIDNFSNVKPVLLAGDMIGQKEL